MEKWQTSVQLENMTSLTKARVKGLIKIFLSTQEERLEEVLELEPEQEQETSFGGMSLRTKVLREHVKVLYHVLSENLGQTPKAFHLANFELRDRELYYKGKSRALMIRGGKLRPVGTIVDILGKEGICDIGFNIPRGKLMARQAIMLNRVEEELPSVSDVAKVDDIELQESTENVARSTENLIEDFPMCELVGLDKQLRSIRFSLKVEVAKKFQLEECIELEKRKLAEI